jgi:hypothetical protein
MIWHNAQKPSRGTRWFIVAVLLFTLVMLYGATLVSPVGASVPQGTAYIECGFTKCACTHDNTIVTAQNQHMMGSNGNE